MISYMFLFAILLFQFHPISRDKIIFPTYHPFLSQYKLVCKASQFILTQNANPFQKPHYFRFSVPTPSLLLVEDYISFSKQPLNSNSATFRNCIQLRSPPGYFGNCIHVWLTYCSGSSFLPNIQFSFFVSSLFILAFICMCVHMCMCLCGCV